MFNKMSTKIVIATVATVAAVAYFLWKLKSEADEDDARIKEYNRIPMNEYEARTTASQLGHCDRRESQTCITTNTASAEKEYDESTRLRRSHSNENRSEREEYPQLIKKSTRSSEQGGSVTEASCSSTAATRSDIPVLRSIPNPTSETKSKHDLGNSSNGHVDTEGIQQNTNTRGRKSYAAVVKEPNQTKEDANQQIIRRPIEKAVQTIQPNRGAACSTEQNASERSMPESDDEEDINDDPFRSEANKHWKLMKEYRQKASKSCHGSEYTQRANEEKGKAEEADRNAMELILQQRSPGFPHCITLDLHRLYVKEALSCVEKFLETNKKHLTGKKTVHIITGKGNHSKGRPTLRGKITGYLTDKEYRFKEDGTRRGEFTVNLSDM